MRRNGGAWEAQALQALCKQMWRMQQGGPTLMIRKPKTTCMSETTAHLRGLSDAIGTSFAVSSPGSNFAETFRELPRMRTM